MHGNARHNVAVRIDTPQERTIRIQAGPMRLPATPLEAARRHFLPGVFSHRHKDESVHLCDDLSAIIEYRVGWSFLSTQVKLLARLEIPSDCSAAAVSFESREGLVPFVGQWKFEPSSDGKGCELYLIQILDTRRVPRFVPLNQILNSTIRTAFDEQLAAATRQRITDSSESCAS